MGERPILFSGPMVRAILAGDKTVTRRVVTTPRWAMPGTLEGDEDGFEACARVSGCMSDVACPYGDVGDTLWVRETWAHAGTSRSVIYRADEGGQIVKWRPSIFMPRWASRLTLRVTGARVERLHAITTADILAEGVRVPTFDGAALLCITGKCSPIEYLSRPMPAGGWSGDELLRAHFASLWDEINGAGAWAKNPFVWVVAFEREVPRG
jgi:hypothetical protein